jgi:hypothetical protein
MTGQSSSTCKCSPELHRFLRCAAGRSLLIAQHGKQSGLGMVSAAVGMTVIFRRSQLTKGMTVALPAKEAEAELDADEQVIVKP